MESDPTQQRALNGAERLVARPPALIFGIPIADVTLAETLERIGGLVRDGRSHRRTHQICTVNVDFLVNALDDDRIATILRDATMCLPDGMPLVWASRWLGTPIRERVAGSDLLPLLVEQSATQGWHVHVFGSAPDVAARAERVLRERYPAARFTIEPGPIVSDVRDFDDETLDGIAAVDADVLCVALGNPKQELFIDAHRERLGIPVMIGVGGSVDMIVGEQRRAPSWMQRTGLEWLWRAGSDPRRLAPRYARDIRVFGPALAREIQRSRAGRHGAGLAVDHRDDVVDVSISPDQQLTPAAYQRAVVRLDDGNALRITGCEAAPGTEALAQLVGLVAVAKRGAGASWSHPGRPQWLDESQVQAGLLPVDDGSATTKRPPSGPEDRYDGAHGD